MPVQYVIEEWDFRDLTLKMRPPVFIPRPETEVKEKTRQCMLAVKTQQMITNKPKCDFYFVFADAGVGRAGAQ